MFQVPVKLDLAFRVPTVNAIGKQFVRNTNRSMQVFAS